MQRLSPPSDSRPQDEPGYNRLHHVCLLWVDYLRATDEADKQGFLYEAATNLVVLYPRGDEGEEVFHQVWRAIQSRPHARAYIKTESGRNAVEACEGGKFATLQILADTNYPVQEGIWQSAKGTLLEVYRRQGYGGLLCVWGANVGLASVAEKAKREAARWQGHLPCDTDVIRNLGPWNYVGPVEGK